MVFFFFTSACKSVNPVEGSKRQKRLEHMRCEERLRELALLNLRSWIEYEEEMEPDSWKCVDERQWI